MITLKDLREVLKSNGVPPYRANQVFHSIYSEGLNKYEDMKILPEYVRDFLKKNVNIFSFKKIKENLSKDKSCRKVLMELRDGNKIEAVLMQFKDGRNTVCVSSQIGCAVKCSFCATGKLKFKRNLTPEEISDQVLYFHQDLLKSGLRVNHIVFMGMGEPFLNYDNVMQAATIMHDPITFNIGYRNITISTSGIIPSIENFIGEKKQINLAISLHAPNNDLREKLMPISKTYHLDDLMGICKKYTDITHRRITYEYIMLRNINDSDSHAHELANLVRGHLCNINLIPYNETSSKFKGSTKKRIESFKKILQINHIPVTVRVSLGKDINAACGQLVSKKNT